MQVSQDQPQPSPHRVKNILIRSFTSDRQGNQYYPETSHILKYAPKYYQSLALQIRPFSPLLSKIKKIKKLKRLEGRTGASFKDILPQNLWFNLLANSRKDIEEIPQIAPNNFNVKLSRSFWRRLNLQRIRLFPNMTRVWLSRWDVYGLYNDNDPFISIPKLFVQYLGNLRKIKSLEMIVRGDNYELAKWVFEKLDEMERLFERLETLIIRIEDQNISGQELFKNKNLFSHVTDLRLSVPFDPNFAKIPQICKNLKSLSMYFLSNVGEKLEFRNLLSSVQHLKQLESLVFFWPEDAIGFWGHFKPQPTLCQLKLIFNVSNLVNEGLFGEDIEPKDAVEHWEDIQELDLLKFSVTCHQVENVSFAKQFITMILKKVRKIRSLNYEMTGPVFRDEPFFVEEVPHLYESLERFGHYLWDWNLRQKPAKFDLKMMKPFINLKELRLDGGTVVYENVEELVSLLEENQPSLLEVKVDQMLDQSWLGETLKKIEKIKRDDKDLEMLFDLRYKAEDLFGLLERLCQDIQAGKVRNGLVISLILENNYDDSQLTIGRLREVLRKYHDICNLKIVLSNGNGMMAWKKLNGENEQFWIDQQV